MHSTLFVFVQIVLCYFWNKLEHKCPGSKWNGKYRCVIAQCMSTIDVTRRKWTMNKWTWLKLKIQLENIFIFKKFLVIRSSLVQLYEMQRQRIIPSHLHSAFLWAMHFAMCRFLLFCLSLNEWEWVEMCKTLWKCKCYHLAAWRQRNKFIATRHYDCTLCIAHSAL